MIGTVAFAASGALVGIHKGMDVFGVWNEERSEILANFFNSQFINIK